MEYMQMTLNDWLEMKQSLERELSNLKTGFIRVGYCLRRIEETKGYEQDGYKSVAEFAKAEYGLSASTVSRFMAINERFSLGGYSERLDPKYIGYHQSIMGEMLGLPDSDLELVTPETSRQDVRELKQFNRQEPERGIADDLRELIENYFRENRDELNEIYNGRGTPVQEILNPSGNKVYHKGMFLMFFYTDCVKTKKFGGDTASYSWEEFRDLIDGIFGAFASPDTYSSYFEGMSLEDGQEDGQEPPAETAPEAAETEGPEAEENAQSDTENAQSDTGNAQAASEDTQSDTETAQSEREAVQDEPKEKPEEAEGATLEAAEMKETVAEEESAVAPAQIDVDRGYAKAVEDAGTKLEEIRQSFERENWMKMSEQLLSLSFIVNQLKVMKKIKT